MPGFKRSMLVLTLAGALCACNKSAQNKSDTPPREEEPAAAQTLADKAAKEKDEVVANLRRELDTLGRDIEALKEKTGKASAKARERTRRQVQSLEEQRDKLSKRIDELGQSTAEGWRELKAATEREADSLKAALRRLRQKDKS